VRKEQALNLTIFEALHATLATPPLFTSTTIFKDASTFEYIGADLTLSNPTREIIAETSGIFGGEARVACILGVGCGHPGIFKVPGESDLASWNLLLERLATNSEQQAQNIDGQMGHLGLYYRFCVSRGLENADVATMPDTGTLLTHTTVYLSNVAVSRKLTMCVDTVKLRDGVASLEQLSMSCFHTSHLFLTYLRSAFWRSNHYAAYSPSTNADIYNAEETLGVYREDYIWREWLCR
jgi:hypothetical protein